MHVLPTGCQCQWRDNVHYNEELMTIVCFIKHRIAHSRLTIQHMHNEEWKNEELHVKLAVMDRAAGPIVVFVTACSSNFKFEVGSAIMQAATVTKCSHACTHKCNPDNFTETGTTCHHPAHEQAWLQPECYPPRNVFADIHLLQAIISGAWGITHFEAHAPLNSSTQIPSGTHTHKQQAGHTKYTYGFARRSSCT